MRIIKNSNLMKLASEHPSCVSAVEHWKAIITHKPDINNLIQLRQRFPHADQVTTESGRTATIFNLGRNYRLITSIHYNHQIAYILRLLTHAEYSKNNWKNEL